jgi:hypothetical protein
VQQVNLYRGHQSAVSKAVDAKILLYAGLGTLCLIVLLAGGGEVYLQQLSSKRALVAQDLSAREAELATFKATLTPPPLDPHLESELGRLRETRDQLNANLVAIAKHTDAASGGFSDYFASLARNTLDGLWFRNVAVLAGGNEMLLKGQALEPELVPQLLQTLAHEPAFSGRSFRKVTFERRDLEARPVVEFELRSAPSVEPDDAG